MLCQKSCAKNTMNVLSDEQIFSALVSVASVSERSSTPVEVFAPHWGKIRCNTLWGLGLWDGCYRVVAGVLVFLNAPSVATSTERERWNPSAVNRSSPCLATNFVWGHRDHPGSRKFHALANKSNFLHTMSTDAVVKQVSHFEQTKLAGEISQARI